MPERLYVRLDGDPLYAPETDVPAGTMREFAVAAPLRDFVGHVALYREEIPRGCEVHERVLPDGAVHLMFNLGDTPTVGAQAGFAAEAAGPSAQPVLLRLSGRLEGVSVTLRPGAACAVLGLPAAALAERSVALDELWRHDAAELIERLATAPDDRARVGLVQALLQRRLQRADPARDEGARRQAMQAARRFADSGGHDGPRAVADALGIGERRLQQLFQQHVGLTPRAWRRLARLHACLRALRTPAPPRWAEVAVDHGFYDQSHLVNEFQVLCGLTPGLFFERVVAGSSKTRG